MAATPFEWQHPIFDHTCLQLIATRTTKTIGARFTFGGDVMAPDGHLINPFRWTLIIGTFFVLCYEAEINLGALNDLYEVIPDAKLEAGNGSAIEDVTEAEHLKKKIRDLLHAEMYGGGGSGQAQYRSLLRRPEKKKELKKDVKRNDDDPADNDGNEKEIVKKADGEKRKTKEKERHRLKEQANEKEEPKDKEHHNEKEEPKDKERHKLKEQAKEKEESKDKKHHRLKEKHTNDTERHRQTKEKVHHIQKEKWTKEKAKKKQKNGLGVTICSLKYKTCVLLQRLRREM